MQGKIIKGIAGFYYVYAEETDTIYECKAKGIFRNRKVKPLVGDLVAIEVLDEEQAKGNITEILPRKNELIRPASANVDQAMVIFAAANPEPNFHLLDRFLVMMDYQNVPTVICFNKEDLIGADEKERLREIYAGADAFIMPSKSEPCGLAQMVACRYGTPPIVRETGGLRDSIHDSTMGDGNGFTFAGYSAHELYEACCHAQDAYNDKENWKNLVHHCMECDYSWDVSAKSYEGLYNETANLW